jgi:hypothetical protein
VIVRLEGRPEPFRVGQMTYEEDELRNLCFQDPGEQLMISCELERKTVCYVVYSSSTASASNERHSGITKEPHVDLLPWILIPTNDDTWCVSIDKEQGIIVRFMSEEPCEYQGELGRGKRIVYK